MSQCENCGAQQEADARFCAQCGGSLPEVIPDGGEAEALRAELARLRAELGACLRNRVLKGNIQTRRRQGDTLRRAGPF